MVVWNRWSWWCGSYGEGGDVCEGGGSKNGSDSDDCCAGF